MDENLKKEILKQVGLATDYQPLGRISFYCHVADIFGHPTRSEALRSDLYSKYESTKDDIRTIYSL